MSLVNITTKRTYSLSQEDVLMIVADYINKTQGTEITPSDLNLVIQDSDNGDWHEPFTPARIKEISVTVEE